MAVILGAAGARIIVHVDGRLVGRSIVLSPLVGPFEFGSLEFV